jgi:hypothetical protein
MTTLLHNLKNAVETIDDEAWARKTEAIDGCAKSMLLNFNEPDYNTVRESLYAILVSGYKPNHSIRVVAEMEGGDNFPEFFELSLEEQLTMYLHGIHGGSVSDWLKDHEIMRLQRLRKELVEGGVGASVVNELEDYELEEAHRSRFGYIC